MLHLIFFVSLRTHLNFVVRLLGNVSDATGNRRSVDELIRLLLHWFAPFSTDVDESDRGTSESRLRNRAEADVSLNRIACENVSDGAFLDCGKRMRYEVSDLRSC